MRLQILFSFFTIHVFPPIFFLPIQPPLSLRSTDQVPLFLDRTIATQDNGQYDVWSFKRVSGSWLIKRVSGSGRVMVYCAQDGLNFKSYVCEDNK